MQKGLMTMYRRYLTFNARMRSYDYCLSASKHVIAQGYFQGAICAIPCIQQATSSQIESVAESHEPNTSLQGVCSPQGLDRTFVWVGFLTKVVTSD